MISLITSAVNLSAITFHHHNANHNYSNTVNLQYPISTHNRYSQHLYYDDDTPNLHIGADISNVLNNDTSYIDLSSVISNFNGTYSSNETNFEDYTQIPYYIRATSMVFCIIIMCMGVIGNVMVPIVILKTKDMRNSTNIFLVNLSIADLMVLLVCTPTVLVEVNTKPETWVLGKELCLAVPFIELTVAHASVLTILAISFERYYAICEPLRAGYVCTKTRATLICALAWFVAAVFTSPILAVAAYQYEEYFDGTIVAVCLTQADTFWPALFFILTISVFFIVPLAILIILYTIIAKNLMENPVIIAHHSKGNNMAGSSVLRYRKQVVLMLGTVVLSFFICLLPFRALTLWIIIVPPETIMSLGLEGYYILLYFCRIMLYLNSAVNPILYNLMSSKFRDGFIKLLSINNCIKCRRQLKDSIHRKDTFNTTTSTNFSSSQNTSDSFWRRYSRTSSQKNTNINDTNNGRNKSIKEGEIGNVQQIKIGEIINVQNTRRNSMRQVAELAALRNDVGAFDFSSRHEDENMDEVLEDLNETEAYVHKDSENAYKNKQIQILNLDVKTNNVYAVTLDMSNGEDNKNKFVCVPLLSGKDGNSVNANKIFEYSSKESFV